MRTLLFVALAVAVNVALARNMTVRDYPSPWTQSGIHTTQGAGQLGQINDHNCGPHSLMQCIYKLTKIDMKESTLASWAGTTTSGTDHAGIAKALSKFNSEHNQKLKIEWHNFNSVSEHQIGQWMANPKTCVFFHLLYRNKWGHYELPYKITSGASSLKIANSLGTKKGEGFLGYIEDRTCANQKSYIHGISQQSVCVITHP